MEAANHQNSSSSSHSVSTFITIYGNATGSHMVGMLSNTAENDVGNGRATTVDQEVDEDQEDENHQLRIKRQKVPDASFMDNPLTLGAILREDESDNLEYKESDTHWSGVMRTLNAFANSKPCNHGRYLLLGVDDSGKVKGIQLDRKGRDELQRKIATGVQAMEVPASWLRVEFIAVVNPEESETEPTRFVVKIGIFKSWTLFHRVYFYNNEVLERSSGCILHINLRRLSSSSSCTIS
jgi:hypothetical protein